MIISLTGFMGCGKSSVGRRLSELLCCPFMDLDQVIEERAGRTIPEIFASDGEAAFRQMELQALQAVVSEGWSKTKSLPRLRRGSLPFTRPRAATVFDSSPTDNCHTHASSFEHLHTNITDGIPDTRAGSEATLEDNEKGTVGMVLALGGGAVMTPECAEIVHSDTLCIYLRASVETLTDHLAGQTADRPLLNTANCHSDQAERVEESAIETLLSQRSATYEKTAHIIIDTDGKSIEAIASEIIRILP